jgi:hypothetical protein
VPDSSTPEADALGWRLKLMEQHLSFAKRGMCSLGSLAVSDIYSLEARALRAQVSHAVSECQRLLRLELAERIEAP